MHNVISISSPSNVIASNSTNNASSPSLYLSALNTNEIREDSIMFNNTALNQDETIPGNSQLSTDNNHNHIITNLNLYTCSYLLSISHLI
jgi:hypothetical protein